jgi:transglutaminase-like putative cysteine protease
MKTLTINSSLNQVKTTLGYMGKLRDDNKADPDFVELARGIVRRAGAQSLEAESEAVRRWIKEMIDFRLDPDGVEYLQDPLYLLTVSRTGDCDDMACLACTLLACVGHECYPVGVCWVGQSQASHAVCWDSSAQLIVDPVSQLPCDMWPGPGYAVREYVLGGRI